MSHRPPFNPKRPLVAAREFTFAGIDYAKGDAFPYVNVSGDAFSLRLIRQQYEARAVDHTDAPPAEAQTTASRNTLVIGKAEGPDVITQTVGEHAVTMKPAAKNGRWEVNAPWLDGPETVRGKVNAESRLKTICEDGPPLGWIAGGSEVTVEGGEGGWYTINAPWLEEAEKVQGRDDAEKRQREIHDAGKPEGWLEPVDHPEVIVSVGEGIWTVTAPWLDAFEDYDRVEDAEARQAQLRADGPPEGWEPPKDEAEASQGADASV